MCKKLEDTLKREHKEFDIRKIRGIYRRTVFFLLFVGCDENKLLNPG
jgi:hypothetical protein